MIGKIKVINSKGYGFIETQQKIDYFFHHSQYKGDWKFLLSSFVRGDSIEVEFENDLTAVNGPRGINVRLKEKENVGLS